MVESQYFAWHLKPHATVTILWHGRYEVKDAREMKAARNRQGRDPALQEAMRFEHTIAPHPRDLTRGEYYLYFALDAGAVVGYFYQLGPVAWNLNRPNPKRYGGWQAREGILARVLAEELRGPGILTPDSIPKIIARLHKAPTPLEIDFNLPPGAGSRLWVAPASTVHYQKVGHKVPV